MLNDRYRHFLIGFIGAFLNFGAEINKIDVRSETIWITVPSDSYHYHEENVPYHDPESFAKRLKKCFIEMGLFSPNCKLKYRVKDVFWTKEMGDENFNKNIDSVIDMFYQ